MSPSKFLLFACSATAFAIAPLGLAHAQSAAVQQACAADAQRLCSNVQPGGGRIVACLKQHMDQVSDRCKQAAGVPVTPATTPNPTPAQAPAPAPAPAPVNPSPVTSTPPPASSTAPTTLPAGPAGTPIKYVDRQLLDTQHNNLRALTIHIPEKWTFEGKLEWHYDWIEYPAFSSLHAENPANAEAYFSYPYLRMDHTEVPPQLRQYVKGPRPTPGSRLATGAIALAPMPPLQALALFIKQTRPNVQNLKWIGQQDLPDLAKQLHLDPAPNQHGVAIKIGYDLNGKPVEEAFFGVYYLSQGTNAGVQAGTLKQTNWGFQALQSFRAPAGTLDQRMPMFCVIAKSVYVNPEWVRLAKAITAQMNANFQQQLKQGYDQIAAAHKMAEQTMAQEKAFDANFAKQEEAMRSQPGADDSFLRDGGARSAADHWSDMIRGVDTLNDPSTGGTKQLSNLGSYHFTDGFGNYRTYDDPNMTPEKAGEVGSWTQMTAVP